MAVFVPTPTGRSSFDHLYYYDSTPTGGCGFDHVYYYKTTSTSGGGFSATFEIICRRVYPEELYIHNMWLEGTFFLTGIFLFFDRYPRLNPSIIQRNRELL